MADTGSLSKIVAENAPLVLVLMGLGFTAIVKLATLVIKQRIQNSNSEFDRLIEKIEELTDTIKLLFKKYDGHNKIIAKQGEHLAQIESRCTERGRRVDECIDRMNKHLCIFETPLKPKEQDFVE